MEDLLIEVLSGQDYPVYLQGTLPDSKTYPDSFFTFWNDFTEEVWAYDNSEKRIEYNYTVNFYSTDPEKVYSCIRTAKSDLKSNNFVIVTDEHSISVDVSSHGGRSLSVKIQTVLD